MIKVRKSIFTFFFVALGLVIVSVLSSSKVSAQSMTLSPSSATVTVGGTQQIQITATNPPATNTASIRLTVPAGLLTITNLSTPGSGYIVLAGTGCGAQYTTTSLCYDIAKTGGGNLTNGELLGTFTVQGVANGVANANFVTGNAYASGEAYTGTGGTYTVGSGGGSPVDGSNDPTSGTLPSTGIFDGDKSFFVYGLFLITAGALIYELYRSRKNTLNLVNTNVVENSVNGNLEPISNLGLYKKRY